MKTGGKQQPRKGDFFLALALRRFKLLLFKIFGEAPSTAEEVEGASLFSACFLKNRPKTGVNVPIFTWSLNSQRAHRKLCTVLILYLILLSKQKIRIKTAGRRLPSDSYQ